MSAERPATVQELNDQLAGTIGAEVEKLMGISGWSEANNMMIDQTIAAARQPGSDGSTGNQPTPQANPVSPAPTPTANPNPTGSSPIPSQDVIDWESLKDSSGKYLGKYNSQTEAAKGIRHAVNMAKDALTQRDLMARENEALKQRILTEQLRVTPTPMPGVVSHGQVDPNPTRGVETTPSPKLAEVLASLQDGEGLNAENLTKLVTAISEQQTEVSRRAAREEIDRQTQEQQRSTDRWNKVDAFMSQNFPESMNHTDEIGLFIKVHPEIGRVVSALIEKDLHEDAMSFAWQSYAKANGETNPAQTTENVRKEITMEAADQVRREAVDAARRDAGILPSAAGGVHGVHENADLGPTQDEYNEAVALYRQGYGEKWRNLVFKDILNHPLLNSM